ncbi:MAG: ATP-binding cassette domain-containing protein [Sandaracinaceae bacterium]|nr:ATP-binding cassette domain-containing protein [Sandaracinaceae bacterium]
MALYEIRGLAKRFGDNVVLQSIDLEVFEGERITLIGKSGSGKSVLLKLMIGLLRPDAGTIVFEGEDVTRAPEREWIEVRKRIGMLFQWDALFDSLDVADNVAYGLREQRVLDEAAIAARVSECLAQVSLPGIEAMWPASLSGGMRKRVGLARAIASRPDVVLYDEPTEGLDPINVTRVDRLLDSLRFGSGVTTVVATQNMQSAFNASDRLALVHGGMIAKAGTPDELREWGDPRIEPFVRSSELRAKTRPSVPS